MIKYVAISFWEGWDYTVIMNSTHNAWSYPDAWWPARRPAQKKCKEYCNTNAETIMLHLLWMVQNPKCSVPNVKMCHHYSARRG